MTKLKIAFFSGDITRSGGTERVGLQIANELAHDLNNQIHIISLWEAQNEPAFNISPKITRTALYDAPFSLTKKFIPLCLKLRHYLKTNKIDYIVDIDVILSLVSIPATLFLKTGVISWEHFHYHESLGCKMRTVGRFIARHFANAIVVLSKADLSNYKKAGSRAPLYHIYNPVIMPKESIIYNKESKIILSVGRLTYQKGFDLIPEMAVEIFKKHPDWQWHIVGEGEDKNKIKNEIEKHKLQNHIKLLGKQVDVSIYYKQAAFYVLTSRFEGFVLVLIEALSFKLPCISFLCPFGPDEIISDEKNGYLIPEKNTIMMTQKIIYLIKSSEKRQSLSNQTTSSLDSFSIDKIRDNWKSLFNDLIKKR